MAGGAGRLQYLRRSFLPACRTCRSACMAPGTRWRAAVGDWYVSGLQRRQRWRPMTYHRGAAVFNPRWYRST